MKAALRADLVLLRVVDARRGGASCGFARMDAEGRRFGSCGDVDVDCGGLCEPVRGTWRDCGDRDRSEPEPEPEPEPDPDPDPDSLDEAREGDDVVLCPSGRSASALDVDDGPDVIVAAAVAGAGAGGMDYKWVCSQSR